MPHPHPQPLIALAAAPGVTISTDTLLQLAKGCGTVGILLIVATACFVVFWNKGGREWLQMRHEARQKLADTKFAGERERLAAEVEKARSNERAAVASEQATEGVKAMGAMLTGSISEVKVVMETAKLITDKFLAQMEKPR